MWLITQTGFYSAVQHRDDQNILVVRTRVYADALHLADFIVARFPDDYVDMLPANLIQTNEYSDYPWRVFVPRTQWVDFTMFESQAIAYGNFKDQVKKTQGYERAGVYGSVWSTLLDLERKDPANSRRRGGYANPIDFALAESLEYLEPDPEELAALGASEDFQQVNAFLTKAPKNTRKRNRGKSKWH